MCVVACCVNGYFWIFMCALHFISSSFLSLSSSHCIPADCLFIEELRVGCAQTATTRQGAWQLRISAAGTQAAATAAAAAYDPSPSAALEIAGRIRRQQPARHSGQRQLLLLRLPHAGIRAFLSLFLFCCCCCSCPLLLLLV